MTGRRQEKNYYRPTRSSHHLDQHAGTAAGRVLLLTGGDHEGHITRRRLQAGPALAHAGAAVHGRGQVAAVGRSRGRAPRPATLRRHAGRRPPGRADEHARVEHVVRVEQRLDLGERASAAGGTWPAAARCGPGRRRVRPTASRHSGDQAGRVLHEATVGARRPPRPAPNGKSIRTWMQPSPKWP